MVTRSLLPACVVLAGRNCRLLRTKQQVAWLCEMPPTAAIHTLKGRHKFPNFRKPFYLVELPRHLCPTSAGADGGRRLPELLATQPYVSILPFLLLEVSAQRQVRWPSFIGPSFIARILSSR